MDETDDFSSSGDDLPEPQTQPPAYTNYRSPSVQGGSEEEWPYSPEGDFIHSGLPSPEPAEGSGTEGHGYLSKGKEMAGKISSAFRRHVKPLPPVLIAVMGKTGTGKTSFVNDVTGGELTVGDDLKACEYSLSTNFPFVYL